MYFCSDPVGSQVSLGSLHLLALRFTAALTPELRLQEAEFEALLATTRLGTKKMGSCVVGSLDESTYIYIYRQMYTLSCMFMHVYV